MRCCRSGLAVIFGLLNVINFSHGALYMVGAFLAYIGVTQFGLNYWVMLVLAPLLVGLFGIVIERTMLRWLYKLDHLYGLLLTFGMTLLLEGVFRSFYGVSGQTLDVPEQLSGRHQPRLHDPAELPRLGGGGLADGLPRRPGS
jgi:branched-chain amino acid transport system permease protein